ncbi:MAG: CDP-alcohol phosphatidyltransferase family protein, partial [Candidatus Aenigmarchaeota archaeon]|nr:CDP-alcohol phosphatidyltransferase family protein [Candidatus Aenigmarchaeota archaeon]
MLFELNKKFPKLKKAILNPFLLNCDPNIMTVLSLIMASISGYLFYKNWIPIASVFLILNGFFDILDGEISRKFNRKTKLGDLLDHTIDRISDVAIFLGISLNPNIPLILGFITLVTILLVSYMGTQFQAISSKRLYSGMLGRSDRIFIIFLF